MELDVARTTTEALESSSPIASPRRGQIRSREDRELRSRSRSPISPRENHDSFRNNNGKSPPSLVPLRSSKDDDQDHRLRSNSPSALEQAEAAARHAAEHAIKVASSQAHDVSPPNSPSPGCKTDTDHPKVPAIQATTTSSPNVKSSHSTLTVKDLTSKTLNNGLNIAPGLPFDQNPAVLSGALAAIQAGQSSMQQVSYMATSILHTSY